MASPTNLEELQEQYDIMGDHQFGCYEHENTVSLDTITTGSVSDKILKFKEFLEANPMSFRNCFVHIEFYNNLLNYLDYYSHTKYIEEISNNKGDNYLSKLCLTLHYISRSKTIPRAFLQGLSMHFSESTKHSIEEILNNTRHKIIVIIFDDSDTNAACKSILLHSGYINTFVTAVWVQEPIYKEFQSNNELSDVTINSFKSKQELITEVTKAADKELVTSASIWSQDVMGAKNLAFSLRLSFPLIYINGTVDMCNRILIPDLKQMTHYVDDECFIYGEDLYTYINNPSNYNKAYYFFYNGTWQKPVLNNYLEDSEKNIWALVSLEDEEMCKESAGKGFKSWNALPLSRQTQILKQFANKLIMNGDSAVAQDITEWMKLSNTFEDSIMYSNGRTVEITKSRRPRGVIVIRGAGKKLFLMQVAQALITGNSVIIKVSWEIFRIFQYFQILESCGFPAGVVNLLFGITAEDLEDEKVAPQIEEDTEILELPKLRKSLYMKYTCPHYIFTGMN